MTPEEIFNKLTAGKSELDVLLEMSETELTERAPKEIIDAIMLNRDGKIEVKPGYDGEYGVPQLSATNKAPEKPKELKLDIKKRMANSEKQEGLNRFF